MDEAARRVPQDGGRMSTWQRLASTMLVAFAASAQIPSDAELYDPKPRVRERAVRSIGESDEGFRHLDRLAPFLKDGSEAVRAAVVVALIKIRTVEAQQVLVQATADESPRIQSLAVDGLVDFYSPGYVKIGTLTSISTFGATLRARFSKPSPLTVSSYVNVNPDAVAALGAVVRESASDMARANAARAIGVLLGHDALDDLLVGVRSRNSMIILESVLAIKKLQVLSAGPEIVFLLNDPDPSIQEAVIQTVGQLRTAEAVPGLVKVVTADRIKTGLRVQALVALAKIPDNGQRELFLRHMVDDEKGLRAAAAEGLGRIADPTDARLIEHHFQLERSAGVKLSLAFAGVYLGNYVRLNDLVEGLNSKIHRLVARPFLVEVSRKEEVLKRLYVPLSTGTVAQRRHLAVVLSQSGTEDSVPHLENLADDPNGLVASAAIEALKVLRSRL